MSLLDFSDTPSRGKGTPRKSLKLILGIGAIAGVVTLSSTLAASINLNSGAPVEFGQGIAQTTACSNGDSLTVTPLSSFSNIGEGAFYFTGVTVADIPQSCDGVDFVISAYNTTGDALTIFNTDSTVASVWNNNESFQAGTGTQGVEIESTTGSFTINFTTPAALATNVARVTLQSTKHADYNCADDFIGCRVGDLGPGGGTIFYVNDSGFSSPGSVCGNNCHNLEFAPANWTWEVGYSGVKSGDFLGQHATWSPFTGSFLSDTYVRNQVYNGTGDQAIGAGYMNTLRMAQAHPRDAVAPAVRAWSGTNNSRGQWFIPSLYELRALNLSSARSSGGFEGVYSSSSERDDAFYWILQFGDGDYFDDGEITIENRNNPAGIRPIRAF